MRVSAATSSLGKVYSVPVTHPKDVAQVKANARALGEKLKSLGYKLVTGGTENHLVMWDLRPEV